MKRNSQYALYKGEKLVGIGTKKELAKLLKVRVETITFYTTGKKGDSNVIHPESSRLFKS